MILLVQGISLISPVQFIVKHPSICIFCVQTLDVHWSDVRCLPLEVDHHLFCFTGVYMPVAAFTPVGDDPLYSSLFSSVTDPTKTVSTENFWR